MQEIKVGEHKVLIYKAAEEMPIKRYTKFQKYNVLESGVGSDIEAIGGHFGKLFEYLGFNMSKESLQEAKNLYYNYYLILEEISIPGMAFACLVYSIDGELITDLSDDNCKVIVDKLSEIGLTAQEVFNTIEDVKKKVHDDLKLYAPGFFDDTKTIEFFAQLKGKIRELSKSVEAGSDTEGLKAINKYLAEYFTPQDFDSTSQENAVLNIDREFELLCAVLESNGVLNAADLTVLQFYLRLEYFKKVNTINKTKNPKD